MRTVRCRAFLTVSLNSETTAVHHRICIMIPSSFFSLYSSFLDASDAYDASYRYRISCVFCVFCVILRSIDLIIVRFHLICWTIMIWFPCRWLLLSSGTTPPYGGACGSFWFGCGNLSHVIQQCHVRRLRGLRVIPQSA